MQGLSKYLATTRDFANAHAVALEGSDADRQTMIGQWQALLNGQKVWAFQKAVAADYTPAADEKVMVEGDSETVYSLFSLIDNPESRVLQLGFSPETIQTRITALGGGS